jgi:hypothetical protein
LLQAWLTDESLRLHDLTTGVAADTDALLRVARKAPLLPGGSLSVPEAVKATAAGMMTFLQARLVVLALL